MNSTAHSIFTPINGIMGAFQLLEQFVEGNLKALKYCTVIKKCLQSLTFQAQNMTEISKLRLKQIQLSKNSINMEHLIKEMYSNFSNEISMKEIQFKTDISQALKNCNIIQDANKLKLILFNLLQNAFKYTRKGIIKITAIIVSQDQIDIENNFDSGFQKSSYTIPKFTSLDYIRRDLQVPDETPLEDMSQFSAMFLKRRSECYYLKISVEDSGIGIHMGQNSQLFKLFGNTKLSQEKIMQSGVGLGLTVSSLLAESMGGRMMLDWTEQDKGTKLDFYIPLKYQNYSDFSLLDTQDQDFYQERNINRNIDENFSSRFSDNSNISQFDIFDDSSPQQMKEEYKQTQNARERTSNSLIQSKSEENIQHIYNEDLFGEQCNIQDQNSEGSQILIVDDNAFNIEILQMMLQHTFGLKSDIAFNGQDAVDKVKMKFDLISQSQIQIEESSSNFQQNPYDLKESHSHSDESKLSPINFLKSEDTFADRVNQISRIKIANAQYDNNSNEQSGNSYSYDFCETDKKGENENQMYKLIIMDINMPVLDGVQATKQIKELLNYTSTPCAIVSHSAMPTDLFKNNAEKWFDGHLQKPIVMNDLKQMIKQYNIKNNNNLQKQSLQNSIPYLPQ
eukprot:403342174